MEVDVGGFLGIRSHVMGPAWPIRQPDRLEDLPIWPTGQLNWLKGLQTRPKGQLAKPEGPTS